jgi:hypothetical protein
MGMKATKKTIRYWQRQVEAFNNSGLTREGYSKENHIEVYRLDYWRKKISRMEKVPGSISANNQWVPLKIIDKSTDNNSRINLWIGSVRIEVEQGFDSKHLTEILRAVGSEC